MLVKGLILLLCVLWMLLCMRFYSVISRDNVWQRRAIAIAAGVGAGLIYFLGSMIVPLLNPAPEEPRIEQMEDIRLKLK